MKQEFFWPIYKQIETEFKELSFYINIDRKQLNTYSIKIADLILRTVSECENIAKALCKKKGIKFLDKNRHVRNFVRFSEYIEKLNKKYNLEEKLVCFHYANAAEDTFDFKHEPFRTEKIKVNKREIEIWSWYHSYNLIKHDRIRNYKKANMCNLINGLAALFLLNIYYKDEVFYNHNSYDRKNIINSIRSFSEVFYVDYTVNPRFSEADYNNRFGESFLNPVVFFEETVSSSTYLIERDKVTKTPSDNVSDMIEKIESSVLIRQKDGGFVKKHENFEFKDHISEVPLIAYIHEQKDF